MLNNTLYNIREEHRRLLELIEQAEGEVSPELYQSLQLNEKDLQECAVSLAFVVKEFEDSEQLIKKEIERLEKIKEKVQKRQELFKRLISEAMQQYGVEKIESATMKLSFRRSEAVDVHDERLVPAHYYDVKPVLSKARIKDAIKSGQNVPGAWIVERKHLQIK